MITCDAVFLNELHNGKDMPKQQHHEDADFWISGGVITNDRQHEAHEQLEQDDEDDINEEDLGWRQEIYDASQDLMEQGGDPQDGQGGGSDVLIDTGEPQSRIIPQIPVATGSRSSRQSTTLVGTHVQSQ